MQGIPAIPSQGSSRTRYPDVRYQATFFTQGAVLSTGIELPQAIRATATADASGVGRATSDIIACSTFKSLENPVGTWNVTLVPRQDYLGQINPGDWCEIQGDNGDGLGMRVLCYGPVKSCDMSRTVGDRGVSRTVIQMGGADYGEVLVKTSGIYDQQLANETVIASFGLGALASGTNLLPGTPGQIVRALIEHYLGRNLPQLIDPRTSQPFESSLNLDYLDAVTLGKTVPQAINAAASLWQLLQQWANLGVNELFADYRPPLGQPSNVTQLNPCVVLRQCPFYGQAWQSLPTITVASDEVMELQMGKSDSDVRNWIRPLDEGDTRQFLTNEKIGTLNPESIRRFGFRRYENPTCYVLPPTAPDSFVGPPSSSAGSIASILKATASLQTLWHHSNEKLLNGSLVLCFRPEIRVGYKVAYTDADTAKQYEFYVEAVSHNFSYPGASSTHLTLTRGRDVADPLWKKPLEQLKAEGVVEELGNTVSDTITQAQVAGFK